MSILKYGTKFYKYFGKTKGSKNILKFDHIETNP
jgi:hypothetical protein